MRTPGSDDRSREAPSSASPRDAQSAAAADVAEDLRAVGWLCGEAGRRESESIASRLPLSPAELQRLRGRIGRRQAEWLITTAALAKPAAEKLGRAGLLVTDRGLQQATDIWVAKIKAGSFPAGAVVWDLCCGVGGDAIALAQRGPVVAVDRDPVICRLAAFNLARSEARSAAVIAQAIDPASVTAGSWVHLDPDRRAGAHRVSDPQHGEPPPATIDAVLARAAGGAIKLAPAAEVPPHWAADGGREWISRGGSCRQQVVWFGSGPSAGSRRATTVDAAGTAHSFTSVADDAASVCEAPEPGECMFDFDPAVRAAGLTAALAARLQLRTLGGPAGFLTADGLPDENAAPDALYQSFAVLRSGAMDEKQLRRTLSDLNVGSLEIKLRGVDLSPERLRKRLLPRRRSGSGRPLTLLIGRSEVSRRTYAVVAERCGRGM